MICRHCKLEIAPNAPGDPGNGWPGGKGWHHLESWTMGGYTHPYHSVNCEPDMQTTVAEPADFAEEGHEKDHDLTVAEMIVALQELPTEIQGYEVWIESDPSSPSQGVSWIWHEMKRVYL